MKSYFYLWGLKKVRNKKLIVDAAYDWCVNKFGSPLKSGVVPDLVISKNYKIKHIEGDYAERIITIYAHNCKSVSALIRVVIHEYTHFMQMPKIYDMSKYYKLSEKYSYSTHPMEVDAYNAELKHFRNCLRYLQRRNVI